MKNTEYKDIFDFGEEALSMNNKFPANSFPSIKNAFTTGEKIRGMNNVSPLATVKFFNQSTNEILTKYYPDADNLQRGNTNLVTDVGLQNDKLQPLIENYYFDNNHNGKFGDSGDTLAFKLLLFVSTDGLKIRECYEVTEPEPDEVILFLETDGGLSKQVLFGKMSENVRKQFTEDGILKSNLYDNEILKGVRKYYKGANQEVIEELMKKGYIEESVIKEGFFKLLKYMGIATTALPKVIGWVLEKLGNWIDYLKIDEQFWDTENENYFLKKENLIENFTISTETIKKMEELLQDKEGLSVTDLMPDAIEEGIQYVLSKTKNTIESYNQFVKEKIEELYGALDNPTADFIFQDLAEGFAFLCGIWNGAVDFISGIFKFAAALLQAPFNIVNDFQTTLELIDNFWDTITTKEFWINLWESITVTYEKIKKEIKNFNLEDFNWVKVAYFVGFGLATIASFFIPVAQFANVTKAGKIGEIIAKFTSEISNGFVKGANIIGQKSAQAYQNSIKIFREVLVLFLQGKEKLTAFFEKIWKKIVEWFKKNKKLLLDSYNKTLLEGWRLLAKFFKSEKIINATNGVEILCFNFNKALVPVDKILMYARGRVRGVENLTNLEKELAELKNLKQTARKVFDQSSENAKRLEKFKKDIDNIKKSLGNKMGLEKAGFVDDLKGNKKVFDYVLAYMNKNAKNIEPRTEYFTKLKGPKGNVTAYMTFSKLPNGKLYLNTIHIF